MTDRTFNKLDAKFFQLPDMGITYTLSCRHRIKDLLMSSIELYITPFEEWMYIRHVKDLAMIGAVRIMRNTIVPMNADTEGVRAEWLNGKESPLRSSSCSVK